MWHTNVQINPHQRPGAQSFWRGILVSFSFLPSDIFGVIFNIPSIILEVILHPRIRAKVSLVYVKPWRFLSGRPGCQALACRSLLALTFKSVASGYTKRCFSAPDIESPFSYSFSGRRILDPGCSLCTVGSGSHLLHLLVCAFLNIHYWAEERVVFISLSTFKMNVLKQRSPQPPKKSTHWANER